MHQFDRILREFASSRKPGASSQAIAEMERRIGCSLPSAVHELYAVADGAVFREHNLELIPLGQIWQWRRGLESNVWQVFPLLDNHDSNPLCVFCDDLLNGYVVQVFHDDSPRLKFRSVENLMDGVARAVSENVWFIADLPGDFDEPSRTLRDVQIGRSLIEKAGNLKVWDRVNALSYAMHLLSEAQADEIARFLDDEDSYVLQDARGRLAAMNTATASQFLERHYDQFEQFVADCAATLRGGGFQTTITERRHIRLDPGPVWLNMEAFFSWHRRDDFEAYLLERAKSFLEHAARRVTPPPLPPGS